MTFDSSAEAKRKQKYNSLQVVHQKDPGRRYSRFQTAHDAKSFNTLLAEPKICLFLFKEVVSLVDLGPKDSEPLKLHGRLCRKFVHSWPG